jgi:regulator of replication initiation timing
MKKTEEQIGIRKRTAKMYIEENKELKKENKELKRENKNLLYEIKC